MLEQYETDSGIKISPVYTAPKHELYKWKTPEEPGELCWKSKKDLFIDVNTYQRAKTSQAKVNRIASSFDWMLFEVLVVALRNDGKHYVIEGGHRLRAAWSREDVDLVPCVVFKDKTVKEEAHAFVESALSVSSISSLDKYKAQLIAENESALRAHELLDRYGLSVSHSGHDKNGITAIQSVIYLVDTAPEVADDVIKLCVDICKSDMQPTGQMIRALKYLIYHKEALGFDISKGALRERLTSIGPELVLKSMRTEAGLSGKGGEKIHARGILNAINKGLRNKLHINI